MERARQTTPTSSETSCTYECELCHDTTWIVYKDEEGRNHCDPCVCQPVKKARDLLRASGLAGFVDGCSFDNFETTKPVQKLLKDTARKYVNDLLEIRGTDARKPWLYIGGNPGSGKTHICTAVCGDLLKNAMQVKYMRWMDDSRRLKFASAEDFEDLVDEFVQPTVLYIDDFLKQKYTPNPTFTDADIKAAFRILDGRYMMNKATIISSEWDLVEHLMGADEAVFSRVYERCKGYTVMIDRKRENNYRLG